MRVAITGVSGFLGWNLARYFQGIEGVEVVGSANRHPAPANVAYRSLDLEQPESIRDFVEWAQADAIVHTAANADAGWCERNPERARAVNTLAVQHLLEAIPTETHFIFCSTDMVFDGLRAPYDESADVCPMHMYGRTKAEAEAVVRQWTGSWSIARLALMYGPGPKANPCFLGWLDAGLRSDEGVRMFSDEYRTALYVEDVARAFQAIIQRRATGVLHLAGPERLSREAFAQEYADVFGLERERIHGVAMPEPGKGLYRPPDLSMDITKAHAALDFAPRTARQALSNMLRERSNKV